MAERRTFEASDHVRADWTGADCVYLLERRARGYDGLLRNVLCTSAALLSRSETLLKQAEADLAACKADLAMLEGTPDELDMTAILRDAAVQTGAENES